MQFVLIPSVASSPAMTGRNSIASKLECTRRVIFLQGKVMLLCFRATQYQSLALAFAKATGSFSPQSAR